MRLSLHPSVPFILVLLIGWEAYCRAGGVSPLLLPAPSEVLLSIWQDRASLGSSALATLGVTAAGFAASVLFAFAISIVLFSVPWLQRGLMLLLVASQTVPIVALAPLMVLWFGFGLLPKILLVILVTFFPMLVSLLSGYARLPQAWGDLLTSMGAGRRFIFVHAVLPVARASFFAGLRISATYAVVAAIFAEYAGSRRGLGIYILTAKNSFRADLVLAAVVISALLTLAFLALVDLVDRLTGRRFRDGRDASD